MEKRGRCSEKPAVFTSISLTDLRKGDTDKIRDQLLAVKDHGIVILNAAGPEDMLVFAEAYYQSLDGGKRFLFRSAAAIPKSIGGITNQPLLSRQRLLDQTNPHGGLIVVGSHVKKSTRQLETLKKLDGMEFIPFDSHLVMDANQLREEIVRVTQRCSQLIKQGVTVAVYTRRELLYDRSGGKEQSLKISTAISQALTEIVSGLKIKPAFIIGKGGITASDIGTKGLLVKKALVMGQIAPGIPVWLTGPESRFPSTPYIIFPGNVGEDDTLYQIVRDLIG